MWFKRLKDKIKEIYCSRKEKLEKERIKENGKRQVSNHRQLVKKEFKRKPKAESLVEAKFKDENIKKYQKQEFPGNPTYESTNISATYDSMYFKWTRVKEYFKETEDIYLDNTINEAKIIMNS